MTEPAAPCPCETFVFPQSITNPPGRSRINYRVGDFIAFREALLRSRPGEVELANWRPGAQGDLAVQMIEWWAYVADILRFTTSALPTKPTCAPRSCPKVCSG